MKIQNPERKLMQHGLQYGQHILLADSAHAAYYLPLRYRIHSVDVIHPFDPVPVALMHSIDAQKTRPTLRIRLATLSDRDRAGPRRLPARRQFAVPRAVTRIVQMRGGDLRQTCKFALVERLELPLQNTQRR